MGLEINGLDTLQTKLDYIAINHTKNIKGKSLLIIVSYFSNTTESLKNYRMMQELKVAFG